MFVPFPKCEVRYESVLQRHLSTCFDMSLICATPPFKKLFLGEPLTAPLASGRVLGASARSVQAGVTAKAKMKNVCGSALSIGWLEECFSWRGGFGGRGGGRFPLSRTHLESVSRNVFFGRQKIGLFL